MPSEKETCQGPRAVGKDHGLWARTMGCGQGSRVQKEGDYHTETSNKHVFKCPPVQSMAFRHEAFRADRPPGPGTYTLPRLMGPNTAYTTASPCYSMKWKSKHDRFDADLSKTPGPAAFPKIEVDTYKRRAPIYTMGAQTRIGGDRTIKPGPADYRTGKVRQPARLSCSVFQRAAFKHLPLLLRLQRTNGLLTAGTSCRTAGLLPAPDPSRGRAEDTAFPFHSLRPYTRLAHPSPSVRVELGDTLQIHGEGNPAKARLGESSGSRAGPAELAMPDGITVLSAQFPFAHKSFS
ncbi:uncharacterized protein [Anas platyrhynchos]|uniref:uncharacterized protein isoform X2 n=1 Tax=Anas platyrhynchos TaxID=8839 RepID=UPI000F7C5B3C|eukprot:XP_027303413.1 uncharacterized protein LOC113840866 isoform X2 [Anas platyrhynchos]